MKRMNKQVVFLIAILAFLVIASGFMMVKLLTSKGKSIPISNGSGTATMSGLVAPFPGFAQVEEKKFTSNGYVIGLGISQNSDWRKAKMIQMRGKVYEIDKTGFRSMTVRMLDEKYVILFPEGQVRLQCEPLNYKGPDGKLIASNLVYLDLKNNYATMGTEKTAAEVVKKFSRGEDIMVVAERVGDGLVARLFVGYGCSL